MITAEAESLGLKARLFRGFSDPTRLAILEALRPGPRSVGELVSATGYPQSSVSTHLACLHGCGLVSRTQQGRFVYYEISDVRVEAILETGDRLLEEVARGIYDCIYNRPDEGRGQP